MSSDVTNLVVFASGSGTNFQSVIDAVESDTIPARITGLISNKEDIQALERARRHGIPVATLKPTRFESRTEYVSAMSDQLSRFNADLIVLAGYLLKIPEQIIREYRKRIINIHPSLLPKYGGKGFYGKRVHRAVLKSGDSETGCTVHYVSEEYDEGPIIAQTRVPVRESDDPDTLAARVLEQEHKLLPAVIATLVKQMNDNSNQTTN